MDRLDTNCAVLARIPDLNTFISTDSRGEEENGGRLAALGGRIFNQSLSFKLLSGLALLLMLASVLPCFFGRNDTTNETASTVDSSTDTWQTETSSATEETRVARSNAPRPATLVPATREQTPAPAIFPSEEEIKNEPPPTPTAEMPLMSSWPNPEHKPAATEDLGSQGPRSGVGRPMAVRPTEYQADASAGNGPQKPGATSPK